MAKRTKGLTEHAAWKLLGDMYGYTGDEEWESDMINSLTRTPLSEPMADLVERWLGLCKDKYRREAESVECSDCQNFDRYSYAWGICSAFEDTPMSVLWFDKCNWWKERAND